MIFMSKVVRLPVVLSGAGVRQLIGLSKLAAATGESQAHAVVQQMEEWQVTVKVGAIFVLRPQRITQHVY